jgi:hypothetical protein
MPYCGHPERQIHRYADGDVMIPCGSFMLIRQGAVRSLFVVHCE